MWKKMFQTTNQYSNGFMVVENSRHISRKNIGHVTMLLLGLHWAMIIPKMDGGLYIYIYIYSPCNHESTSCFFFFKCSFRDADVGQSTEGHLISPELTWVPSETTCPTNSRCLQQSWSADLRSWIGVSFIYVARPDSWHQEIAWTMWNWAEETKETH